MIPKILHYCWFGNAPKPDVFYQCYESWKKYLPDWEIVEWNDSNISQISSPFLQFMYLHMEYSYMSDYMRHWCLYHYGGVYVDTDVLFHQSINCLCETYSAMIAYENLSIGEYGHFFMGAEPYNSYMKQSYTKTDAIFSKKLLFEEQLNTICYDTKWYATPNMCILPENFVTQNVTGYKGIYATHLSTHNWSPRRLEYILSLETADFPQHYRIRDSLTDKIFLPTMIELNSGDLFLKILPNTNITICKNQKDYELQQGNFEISILTPEDIKIVANTTYITI